jgi:hypothetical protein
MRAGDGLPIGKLAEQSGVNIETIRYYEKVGVMPSPDRTAGGYRVYGPSHVKRLSFVRRGRELADPDSLCWHFASRCHLSAVKRSAMLSPAPQYGDTRPR